MQALATRANLDAICDFAVTLAATRPRPTSVQRARVAKSFAGLPEGASMLLEHYRERGLDDKGLRVVGLAVLDPGSHGMPPVGVASILAKHWGGGFPRAWVRDATESADIAIRVVERGGLQPMLRPIRGLRADLEAAIVSGDGGFLPRFTPGSEMNPPGTVALGALLPVTQPLQVALRATIYACNVVTATTLATAWWNTALAAIAETGWSAPSATVSAKEKEEDARSRAWRRMVLALVLERPGLSPGVLADIVKLRATREGARRASDT